MMGVRHGINVLNVTVYNLSHRITEVETRISQLENVEAERGPVVEELSQQKRITGRGLMLSIGRHLRLRYWKRRKQIQSLKIGRLVFPWKFC